MLTNQPKFEELGLEEEESVSEVLTLPEYTTSQKILCETKLNKKWQRGQLHREKNIKSLTVESGKDLKIKQILEMIYF